MDIPLHLNITYRLWNLINVILTAVIIVFGLFQFY